MARRHLFLAVAAAGFGEVLVGIDLARALHAAGDYVAFLHPGALALLFKDLPFRTGTLDFAMPEIEKAVGAVVRERHFDTVILVDITSVTYTIGAAAVRALLRGCQARLIGLDLWSLTDTDLTWDVSDYRVRLDPVVLEVPALRPSPIASPRAPGAFRALPELTPMAADERRRVRAELGLASDERLIVSTTAEWQMPRRYRHRQPHRFAFGLPGLYQLVWRRLERARLYHVGPQPLAWAAGDPSYRNSAQLPPAEFRRILGAADLLLTVNVVATSIAAAISLGVPVALITSGKSGATATELEVGLRRPMPADLATWIAEVLPFRPFWAYPIGLHSFLDPVLAGNPYAEALEKLELLDLEDSAARVQTLLDDPDARAQVCARQDRYRDQVRELPSGVERVRELSGG